MGMVSRMVQPGVVITLHTAIPTGRGGELVKSGTIPLTSFSESGNRLTNRRRIDMEAERAGTMRYAAAWIENALEGYARLEREEPVQPGDVVYFDRGELRIERERR